MTFLADHDVEGQTRMLWETLISGSWLDLLPLRLATFAQVGLSIDTNDREVWRYAQVHGMILLTGNRSMDDEDSLERIIREENTVTSLPILTFGNADRVYDRAYRERCATRLMEIVTDLDNYLGTGRIFIP